METMYNQAKADFLKSKFNSKLIPEIELIEIELFNMLSDSKGTIRDMCTKIINAGGKRIRPLLVMYSGLAFSPVLTKEIIHAATAAELIHMASLVHDDIIDNSKLRHNRASVNSSWGNHFAVLCGDYLFSKAFGVLSNTSLSKSLELMVKAIENMCQGEILQANNRYNVDIDVSTYYEIISKKTAIFIECCCISGAFVSGATKKEAEALGGYGLNMGLAFQIMDDILDMCGKTNIMGKPKFEDLQQGNITLPIIMLLKEPGYRDAINEVIKRDGNIEIISSILEELNIIEECYKVAVNHIKKAQNFLSFLPQSEYKTKLYDVANMLMVRSN
ncbi:UNVERIFIED_CONTAM: heptaprenyl diphosphate synthase [Acetivibrio alkalicellulosi]